MDVRALGSSTSAPKCLFFPRFRGLDRSFWPRTSAGISAWTSTGYPAPKLTLWAAFSFLFSRIGGGAAGASLYTPSMDPVAPTFSALKGDVALQVAQVGGSRCDSRSTGGCRSYAVARRATMGHLVSNSLCDSLTIQTCPTFGSHHVSEKACCP